MNVLRAIVSRCMAWVWRRIPSCAEMARLASQSLEQPAPWRIRFSMRLHVMICAWCRRYQKQLQFIHRFAPGSTEHLDLVPGPSLSDEARQRILARLADEKREANGGE